MVKDLVIDSSYHRLTLDDDSYKESCYHYSVAEVLVQTLYNLGVRIAMGLSGGAVAGLWDAFQQSLIKLLHYRHESGAAFAATEYYFACGRPAAVISTTGPGITNAITGLFAARWEGAKLIFLSASTANSQRGRWSFQETGTNTMGDDFFSAGPLFHYAARIESPNDLPVVAMNLMQGLARPSGFIAHISVPTTVQTSPSNNSLPVCYQRPLSLEPNEESITKCKQLLSEGPFAIWLGFGARSAASSIRHLAERTGAAVMCSPRGKGIFPEEHQQFVGVTGFGGHDSVLAYMKEFRPLRTLVLGSRLGEFTSFWNPDMVPEKGFIHIDIDPTVPCSAYPSAPTFAIQSDVEEFVIKLIKLLPERRVPNHSLELPKPDINEVELKDNGPVCPDVLMDAIQRIIVDNSDAIVMTEAGNAFAWGTNALRFSAPNRYRVSTGFGSMGHAVTGVLGAALARNSKAVAIVGDGAMLMNNEINTAVHYRLPVVWIVLNDSCYGMIEHGMRCQGYNNLDVHIPHTDFVQFARSMGANGIKVTRETELDQALRMAMAATGPFVVDVEMDASIPPPFGRRVSSLIAQGLTGK
ncbi:MAG: thiamine pyrophosphate-dependent enzyme [Acidobacteriota bacterium]